MLCILWCVEELHCVGDTSSTDNNRCDDRLMCSGERRAATSPSLFRRCRRISSDAADNE